MKYCNKDCLNCKYEKCIEDYTQQERQRILQSARYKRWLEKNRERRRAYQHAYYLKRKEASGCRQS